jgi:hypothetical protein
VFRTGVTLRAGIALPFMDCVLVMFHHKSIENEIIEICIGADSSSQCIQLR